MLATAEIHIFIRMHALLGAAYCKKLPAAASLAEGLMDRFDQPEILDDLLDGWVANVHKGELASRFTHKITSVQGQAWPEWAAGFGQIQDQKWWPDVPPRWCRGHQPQTAYLSTLQPPILTATSPPSPTACAADERLQFIHLLQRFSERHHLRVSILSGDAHVGGVGRLYSRPKMKPMG